MNRMKICLVLLSIISFKIVVGQSRMDSIVNSEAKRYMSNKNAVGLSIGILFDDRKVSYNYGVKEKSQPEPPTENSIYCIGSISKTFISFLLAKAVLEKRAKLHDEIRNYLPDSIKYGNLQFGNSPIRLINLSNHTSGIPTQLAKLPANWNKFSVEEKYLFKKSYTKEFFLRDLATVQLDTLPGSKYDYSNAGAKLLSLILERIYRMPYNELVKKYIAHYLNMNDTKVFLDKQDWERFAVGGQDLNLLIRTKDIDDFTSGPVLNSTVKDMLKYLALNISERNAAIKLTHKTTFRNLEELEIGLAWRIKYTAEGEKYFYHSGAGWGCNSICLFSPAKKIGVVVLANETSDQDKIIELGTRILTQALGGRN